jgi:hypothetical protein
MLALRLIRARQQYEAWSDKTQAPAVTIHNAIRKFNFGLRCKKRIEAPRSNLMAVVVLLKISAGSMLRLLCDAGDEDIRCIARRGG